MSAEKVFVTPENAVAIKQKQDAQNAQTYLSKNDAASTYQAQEAGKGLSTNDYTTADQTKLNGIAAGAEVNVVETISVNGTAQQVIEKGVNISVPTNTNQLTNGADFATNTEVDTKISAAMTSAVRPAGSVATVAELPTLAANVLGFFYNLTTAGVTTADFVSGAGNTIPAGANILVVDTGAEGAPVYKFDVVSGFVDLSAYQLTSDLRGMTETEINNMFGNQANG